MEARCIRRRYAHEIAAGYPGNGPGGGKGLSVSRNERGDTRAGNAPIRTGCLSRGHLFYEISRLVILDQENFAIVFVHPDVAQINLRSLVRCKQDVLVGGVLLVFEFGHIDFSAEMIVS